MKTLLSYGSFDLQSESVVTQETDVWSPAVKNVQVEPLAQHDGGSYVRDSLAPKTFSIAGTLQGADTRAETDALIDAFVLGLSPSQTNFDIDNGSGKRRYICTAKSPVLARKKGLNTVGFSVEFVVPSGVGSDVDTSVLLAPTAITTATSSTAITVGGTYIAEPTIRLVYSAISGGTAKTVSISNGTTLRGIQITRNWVSGDVLELDSTNMSLYVNSIPVDFSGMFPEWDVGTGAITVIDDFTTRTGSLSATYTRRWL